MYDEILTGVLRTTTLPSEIEDFKDVKNSRDSKRFSVIIFVDSIDTFNKFFERISSKNFKFRRHFTVVLTKNLELDEVGTIIKKFWKVFIKFVNIVKEDNLGTVELFTFFPFNDQKCSDTEPIVINVFDNNLMKWKNNNFQPSKTKNLYNCPLVIGGGVGTSEPNFMATFDSHGKPTFQGSEHDIFILLSEQLNFNPRFEAHGNFVGLLYDNGTATGD